MREYVLSDAEHLYKIGLNGKKQLSLIAGKGRTCSLFFGAYFARM